MLDLQQQHTGLIDHARISQRVRATVISYYPGRGTDGTDEAMVDAGAIAFSKDTGPSGVFGEVIGLPWVLSRISQEHGILTRKEQGVNPLKLGTMVDIVGQHACLIAAVSKPSPCCEFTLLTFEYCQGLPMVLHCRSQCKRWSGGGRYLGTMEGLVVRSD